MNYDFEQRLFYVHRIFYCQTLIGNFPHNSIPGPKFHLSYAKGKKLRFTLYYSFQLKKMSRYDFLLLRLKTRFITYNFDQNLDYLGNYIFGNSQKKCVKVIEKILFFDLEHPDQRIQRIFFIGEGGEYIVQISLHKIRNLRLHIRKSYLRFLMKSVISCACAV